MYSLTEAIVFLHRSKAVQGNYCCVLELKLKNIQNRFLSSSLVLYQAEW